MSFEYKIRCYHEKLLTSFGKTIKQDVCVCVCVSVCSCVCVYVGRTVKLAWTQCLQKIWELVIKSERLFYTEIDL